MFEFKAKNTEAIEKFELEAVQGKKRSWAIIGNFVWPSMVIKTVGKTILLSMK